MKRTSILASAAALSLLTFTLGQSCSSDEGAGDDDNSMNPLQTQGGAGSIVPGMGGTAPVTNNTGGTTGTVEGQGGVPVTNNTGGTATSPSNNSGGTGAAPAAMGGTGAAPAAMGGTGGTPPVVDPNAPPACIEPPAPSNDVACTVTCTDPCSVHALGTRVCTCTNSLYACGACAFATDHPLITAPTEPLTPCTLDDSDLEDVMGCTDNERCESIRVNGAGELSRFCGCLGGRWDCDSKPQNFPR